MDEWGRTIVLSTLAIFLIAIAVITTIFYRRSKRNRFHAHAEYWVYSAAKTLPNQDSMMARVVGDNPYIQRGQNPIGAPEGLLFSDIRLVIALVLRSKNPNLFQADKLPESIPDHHEFVNDINGFESFVKLQYASPTKLKDKRHLQFLLHACDAEAELCQAKWIYDKVTGELRTKDELADILAKNFSVTGHEFHVRLENTEDQTVRSYGLVKIGIPDFETQPVPHDQVSLVNDILEKYVALCWERGEMFPDPIRAYDDEFFLLQERESPLRTRMRIVRKQLLR